MATRQSGWPGRSRNPRPRRDGVNVELVSHRIWEAKEEAYHPHLGPRQSELFYMQSIIFEPGISFSAAKRYMNTVLDTFFEFGEGKEKGKKF